MRLEGTDPEDTSPTIIYIKLLVSEIMVASVFSLVGRAQYGNFRVNFSFPAYRMIVSLLREKNHFLFHRTFHSL